MTAISPLKGYRGNKAILGLYQWIINRIPPHKQYIEAFAGSAAIAYLLKAPAGTVINDKDHRVTDALNCSGSPWRFSNLPAAQLLSSIPAAGATDTFIYCDPPYKFSTRGSNRRIYEHEMSDSDHNEFLSVVRTATYNCMISHYECEDYNNALSTWTKETFKVCYNGKVVNECIYYNYPKPSVLQCYDFVGNDCWDRQRINRKIDRLSKKLAALPALERNAVIARLCVTVQSNCPR